MTTVTLSLFAGAGAQFLDNSGNVLTGGLVYTYSAGTTTPLATYTSNLGTSAHPNPIVLDASGRVPGGEIWLTTGLGYKFVLKDTNNVLIGTYDNVPSSAQPPIVNDASSIAYEQGNTTVAGYFITGQTYLITFLGTTNFQAIGASANEVGTHFVATGPGTGTGTGQLSITVEQKLRQCTNDASGIAYEQGATVSAGSFVVGNQYVISTVGTTNFQLIGASSNNVNVLFTATGVGSGTGVAKISRTVEVKLQESVSIEDFGAKGDGITDDTAAFNAFNTWAVSQGSGVSITLKFGLNKTYMVANPFWPTNIPNLIVNGNGSKLQNNATINVNKDLLHPASGTNATTLNSFYTPVNRYLINSTTVGLNTITCSIPSDVNNLSVGEMIMVASYDIQFGGAPCNYKYFEYNIISAKNASTGVITLKDNIQYAHLSNSPYTVYATGDGRAHIEKIEQANLFNINHQYNDIVFVKNVVGSGDAVSEAVFATGYNISFNNCSFPNFVPTIANTITVNDSIFTNSITEIDKLITTINFNNCNVLGIMGGATSALTLNANNTIFSGGYQMSPVSLNLNNCQNPQNALVNTGYGYTKNVNIQGGSINNYPSYTIDPGQIPQVIIDTNATWNASTSTLTIPITPNTNSSNFVSHAEIGQLVCQSQTAFGGPDAGFGFITSVTGGLDVCYVTMNFSIPITTGMKLSIYDEPQSVNLNNTKDYLRLNRSKLSILKEQVLTSGLATQNILCFGRLKRIVFDVIRPYTGSTGGNVTLNFLNQAPNYNTISFLIDLKTSGRREATQIGFAGWSGAGGESAGAALSSGSYLSQYIVTYDIFVSTFATSDPTQLPIVNVYAEFENPLV